VTAGHQAGETGRANCGRRVGVQEENQQKGKTNKKGEKIEIKKCKTHFYIRKKGLAAWT